MKGAITRDAGYGQIRIVLTPCRDYRACRGFRLPGGHMELSVRADGFHRRIGRVMAATGMELCRRLDEEDRWFETPEACAEWCRATALPERADVYAGGI